MELNGSTSLAVAVSEWVGDQSLGLCGEAPEKMQFGHSVAGFLKIRDNDWTIALPKEPPKNSKD